jgi:hypothetical protein
MYVYIHAYIKDAYYSLTEQVSYLHPHTHTHTHTHTRTTHTHAHTYTHCTHVSIMKETYKGPLCRFQTHMHKHIHTHNT